MQLIKNAVSLSTRVTDCHRQGAFGKKKEKKISAALPHTEENK